MNAIGISKLFYDLYSRTITAEDAKACTRGLDALRVDGEVAFIRVPASFELICMNDTIIALVLPGTDAEAKLEELARAAFKPYTYDSSYEDYRECVHWHIRTVRSA